MKNQIIFFNEGMSQTDNRFRSGYLLSSWFVLSLKEVINEY